MIKVTYEINLPGGTAGLTSFNTSHYEVVNEMIDWNTSHGMQSISYVNDSSTQSHSICIWDSAESLAASKAYHGAKFDNYQAELIAAAEALGGTVTRTEEVL